MDAPKNSDSSPALSSTALASSHSSEITRQYESASEESSSSVHEKDSLDHSDAESASSLLLDAQELEAQSELLSAPPQDLVPRRTKMIFVALYFLLNLSLTLSNKSVLSRVSALSPPAYIRRPETPHGAFG
jgi:hypothetical protein